MQHSALEMLASNGPNQFLSAPAHGFLVTFSPDNFLQFPNLDFKTCLQELMIGLAEFLEKMTSWTWNSGLDVFGSKLNKKNKKMLNNFFDRRPFWYIQMDFKFGWKYKGFSKFKKGKHFWHAFHFFGFCPTFFGVIAKVQNVVSTPRLT